MASQRTGVCLSPGLYGFMAWIHFGHSCYLCFDYTKHTYQAQPDNFCFNEVLYAKLLAFYLTLRRPSVNRSGWSFFRPEVRSYDLMPFFTKKGEGQRNRFWSGALMWPFSLLNFYRFLCSFVTYPRSQTRFPLFFSMDNLRGYGEDEPSSSSRLGPSSQELPASSAGSATLP